MWGEIDTRFSCIATCYLSMLQRLGKIDEMKAMNCIMSWKTLSDGSWISSKLRFLLNFLMGKEKVHMNIMVLFPSRVMVIGIALLLFSSSHNNWWILDSTTLKTIINLHENHDELLELTTSPQLTHRIFPGKLICLDSFLHLTKWTGTITKLTKRRIDDYVLHLDSNSNGHLQDPSKYRSTWSFECTQS